MPCRSLFYCPHSAEEAVDELSYTYLDEHAHDPERPTWIIRPAKLSQP
jgi:hypothetical protein